MSSSSKTTGSPSSEQEQQMVFGSDLIFPDALPFPEMSAIQRLNWQPQELFPCNSSVITGNSSYLLPQYNALSKKRKVDQNHNQNTFFSELQVKAMGLGEKKNRGNVKKEKRNNSESSAGSSSKTGKINNQEFQKGDFIHVRARRGQATDSHSLAERVRREKISERMKYLQDLVPGCNKITGKAGMLDEIINYVQSLQRQVEFLSMKLAAVNPKLDLSLHNFFAKEVFSPFYSDLPLETLSSPDLSHLQLQQLQQWCDLTVRTADQTFQVHDDSSGWDTELHNLLYNMAFSPQQLPPTGVDHVEVGLTNKTISKREYDASISTFPLPKQH